MATKKNQIQNNVLISDGCGSIEWGVRDNSIIFSDEISYGEDTCSKCGEYGKIANKYNWDNKKELVRNICKNCHTEALDRFYGLSRNVKTEKVLYGKKDK